MQLVFLYGAPATGKYTIGCELAALTGYELYHNHLVVDELLKQHAFGTPDFVRLRDQRWREYFTRAAAAQPPGIIFTFNPENTVPQAFIDWLFHDLTTHDVHICAVELIAPEAVIEERIAAKSRQQFGKLTNLALYRQLRATGAFTSPIIPQTDWRIDTEQLLPQEAAVKIAHWLDPRSE
jgi:hypothetical protein